MCTCVCAHLWGGYSGESGNGKEYKVAEGRSASITMQASAAALTPLSGSDKRALTGREAVGAVDVIGTVGVANDRCPVVGS